MQEALQLPHTERFRDLQNKACAGSRQVSQMDICLYKTGYLLIIKGE